MTVEELAECLLSLPITARSLPVAVIEKGEEEDDYDELLFVEKIEEDCKSHCPVVILQLRQLY